MVETIETNDAGGRNQFAAAIALKTNLVSLIGTSFHQKMENNGRKDWMINDMFWRGLGTGWLAVALLLAIGSPAACQDTVNPDEEKKMRQEIVNVLQAQAGCCNRKDIEGFMQSYWKSDQLTFSGSGKTIRGWQATLDRYQEKYPPEKMGQLAFDHLEITPLSSSASLVLGQWHLSAAEGKSNGNFSLVFGSSTVVGKSSRIIHRLQRSISGNLNVTTRKLIRFDCRNPGLPPEVGSSQ